MQPATSQNSTVRFLAALRHRYPRVAEALAEAQALAHAVGMTKPKKVRMTRQRGLE